MCTNYAAARRDQLFKHFGIEAPAARGAMKYIRTIPRRPRNVRHRSEATHTRRGQGVRHNERPCGDGWRKALVQRGAEEVTVCLIPCNAIYEPNYESGKAVRWRISMSNGEPFAVAGLWREWNEPEGFALSFTMLTLNAEEHPLMNRLHRPGSEKRSVVIVTV